MEITVRKATEADYTELKEFFDEGADIHHRGEPGIIGTPSERPISKAFVSELINGEDTTLLVAMPSAKQPGEHKLLGFVRLAFHDTGSHQGVVPRRYVEVEEILVREAYRGHRIGHRLMLEADRWAREKGATEVELAVWDFNHGALKLYEELGYRTLRRQMLKSLPLQADNSEALSENMG